MLSAQSIPTLLPTEYIPTSIALTVDAAQSPAEAQSENPAATPLTSTQTLPPPTETAAPQATSTPTLTPDGPTATPYTLPPPPTSTPLPDIPFADIELLNLGPLSRVTSPIFLSAYLKTGANGRVLVELLGEDKRLLFREVKVIRSVPAGTWASLKMDLDFEIAAAAEAGRLQLSVEDEFKRTTALNSVPLILLSIGEPDIYPPTDLLAPILIQKPLKKSLVQGGTLLVSGMLRGTADQPVLVRLLTETGGEVGSRLANVAFPPEGSYGTFDVEVPYTLQKPANILVVVTQGDPGINDVIHLTSVQVMLGP